MTNRLFRMTVTRTVSVLIAFVLMITNQSASATTFVIDSLRRSYFSVSESNSVEVIPGGIIDTEDVAPEPNFSVSFGIVAHNDSAHVLMAGGEIYANDEWVFGIDLRGGADLIMTSGRTAVGYGPRSYGVIS